MRVGVAVFAPGVPGGGVRVRVAVLNAGTVGVYVLVPLGVFVGWPVGVTVSTGVLVRVMVRVAVMVGTGVPPVQLSGWKKAGITCPRESTGAGRLSACIMFVGSSSMFMT